MIFDVEIWLWKSNFGTFWHLLHYSNLQNSMISFDHSWFLAKNLFNFVSFPWNSTTGIAITNTYVQYSRWTQKVEIQNHLSYSRTESVKQNWRPSTVLAKSPKCSEDGWIILGQCSSGQDSAHQDWCTHILKKKNRSFPWWRRIDRGVIKHYHPPW